MICEICGKEFESKAKNHRFCCAECPQEAKRRKEREDYAAKKIKPEKPKTVTTNELAVRNNMSYGKYVGQLWLKENATKVKMYDSSKEEKVIRNTAGAVIRRI